jgi:phosphoribosylaminoimidazole-succinocarboxamide synthase
MTANVPTLVKAAMSTAVLQTTLPGMPVRQGKVRDIYDFGDRLLFVASDRISAFDWVLPNGIRDKGRVLTQVSRFWFDQLDVTNHVLSLDPTDVPLPDGTDVESLRGRSMVVRKTKVVPIECVVRGYLAGSGWKEYQASQTVCGIPLPAGLLQADQLPEPMFTPATKAETGHDENISFEETCKVIGEELATRLRDISISIYRKASEFALERGIILADTKFEFGLDGDEIVLIDEVLTPDSSRYWPADRYEPGQSPFSYDKQFVRDWLETTDWDKNSPPPNMPEDIAAKTRAKYIEAFEVLTGESFPWK